MFTKSSHAVPLVYEQQLYEPLLDILSYLCVNDLATLAGVSRKFYAYVEAYYEETCKRLLLAKSVYSFFKGKPVCEKDQSIKEILVGGTYSYKWLFTTWKKTNRIYRKSLTNIWFPQENIYNFVSRDMKSDRRLHHMTHKFSHVVPGIYRAAMRVKMNNMTRNQYGESALIKITWKDSYGCHEKKAELKWERWRSLRDYLKRSSIVNINGAMLSNYNPATGWFDFCFEQFILTEKTSIFFEFHDLINNWLKAGMRWNYLELKPVDWRTT